MDISQFNIVEKANEGAFMQLCTLPTNTPIVDKDGTKVGITLLGFDSDKCRKLRLKATNQALNRKRGQKTSAEEIEARGIKQIAECGVSWQGIDKGGKPLLFSAENFEQLLTDQPWVKEQCDEFIGDRNNFLQNA